MPHAAPSDAKIVMHTHVAIDVAWGRGVLKEADIAREPSMSAAQSSPPLLMTVQAAAAALSVSADTIHRRLRDGALTAVRCGGRTLIRRDVLEAYIDSLPAAGGGGGAKG